MKLRTLPLMFLLCVPAAVQISSAKEPDQKNTAISYPEHQPAFTVNVPSNWRADATPDRLILKKNGSSDLVYIAQIPPSDAVTDEAAAKAWIPKKAKALLKAAGIEIEDISAEGVNERLIIGHQGFAARGDGIGSNASTDIGIQAFTPDGKTYFYLYTIVRFDGEMMNATKEQSSILDSLSPAKR